MAKRHKMRRSASENLFTSTAKRIHPKNALGASPVMRGGIRF